MKRLLFVVLLLLAGTLASPGPAQATGACVGNSGVTVVVQFRDEPVRVGCALGDPSSGYQALQWAGFAITNVPSQPQAVCTINRQPDLDQESCWSKSNFWGYWHGEQDDPDKSARSWHWSTSGAYYNPKPGGYEGWHFGSGSVDGGPAYPVPPVPAKATAQPPTPHASPAASNPGVKPAATGRPSSSPTSSAAGARASGSATATATGSPSAGSSPTGPATGGSAGGATGTATGTGTAASQGAAEAAGPLSATRTSAEKAPAGRSWIWGLLLLAVLAGAAAGTAVRRRKA